MLDMSTLDPERGLKQAFVELLVRLWRELPGLEITDLVLSANPKQRLRTLTA